MLPERSNLGAASADGAANEANAASGAPPKARDLLEGEAGSLEDAALVKLSYVCLCLQDYSGALRYSRRLLDKNCLLPQTTTDGNAKDQAEEVRKHWAFQAPNLPQSPGATGSTAGKFPSSVG